MRNLFFQSHFLHTPLKHHELGKVWTFFKIFLLLAVGQSSDSALLPAGQLGLSELLPVLKLPSAQLPQ